MRDVGAIFSVAEEADRVRYFWCVGTDQAQLHSAIVVVFRRSYPAGALPDFDVVIQGEVAFYCHVFLASGKRSGHWKKVGFRNVTRSFPMLFRDSDDYGDPSVHVSERWYVWEPNQPFRVVGKLTGDLTAAEIGVVLPPDSVVERIRTGKYGMQYPSYDASIPARA